MECGSVGVLRQVGIAPRDREVGDAEGAEQLRVQSQMYRSSNRRLCFFRSTRISSWKVILR